MDILTEKWMIYRYLEFVNDTNNVYLIKADAGINIRSTWHTYYISPTLKNETPPGV